MQIDFSSSGGFVNQQLTYQADTKTLPEDQVRELERLVESSGVFDMQNDDLNTSAAIGRADVISYRLTISDGPRQATLWMNDVTVPATLRPLLAHLRTLALEQKKRG